LGIYNAASTVKNADPSAAVELYEEAAKHDPRYLERGYWWREKGESLWNSGDPEAALDCYREATRLGDQAAQAYSADVLMRTGRYREAREAFTQAPIFENARDAQWRLSLRALNFIIDELGIPDQSRTPDQKPTFEAQHLETMKEDALAALQNDALDGSAHFALSMALAAEGVPQIGASIADAVTVIVNPVGWLNLFSQAMKNGSLSDADRLTVAFDSMICAWKYFGPDFGEEILSDESMTEELRGEVLALFESVKPDAAPFEIRFHEEGGKFQSVMVPMR
jgi:tetratricopeptide (TPR) repeat protein